MCDACGLLLHVLVLLLSSSCLALLSCVVLVLAVPDVLDVLSCKLEWGIVEWGK